MLEIPHEGLGEAGVGLCGTVEKISDFSIGSHVGAMNERGDENRPSDWAYFRAATRRSLYIKRTSLDGMFWTASKSLRIAGGNFVLRWYSVEICSPQLVSSP
jgi:hypothetical protein